MKYLGSNVFGAYTLQINSPFSKKLAKKKNVTSSCIFYHILKTKIELLMNYDCYTHEN